MTKPKIKKELPEKQLTVTKEKVGKPIEEDFLSDEEDLKKRVKKGQAEKKRISEKAVKDRKKAPLNKQAPKPEPVMSQPNLYGEADQILNTLETGLTDWRNTLEKLMNRKEKVEILIEDAHDMIKEYTTAVKNQVKLAPKAEDPAAPDPKPAKKTAEQVGDEFLDKIDKKISKTKKNSDPY